MTTVTLPVTTATFLADLLTRTPNRDVATDRALHELAQALSQTVAIGGPVRAVNCDTWHEEDAWFAKFLAGNDGRILSWQVADGYALYFVSDDYVIHHVPAYDGYQVRPETLKGLTRADIDRRLAASARV